MKQAWSTAFHNVTTGARDKVSDVVGGSAERSAEDIDEMKRAWGTAVKNVVTGSREKVGDSLSSAADSIEHVADK
eukprot:scaffold432558_cov47-Prasinocladus_malaysianus.AAC.1